MKLQPIPQHLRGQKHKRAFQCCYKRDLVDILDEIYNNEQERINWGWVAVICLMLEIQYMV